MHRLEKSWYNPGVITYFLLPVSWLFCFIVFVRRTLYKLSILKSYTAPLPVIVVGNINVGGTGKTPIVVSLINVLKRKGYRPGIISRGYGRSSASSQSEQNKVLSVTGLSDPEMVGDEPVLLAQRCDCPVRVSTSRVKAVEALIAETDCNIIVSDDGLQHYALKRDIEIAVIDGERRFGNGHCLPAGPLREKPHRLKNVDMILVNGQAQTAERRFSLVMSEFVSLKNGDVRQPLENLKGKTVHAIAGIGNPARFFQQLRSFGIDVLEHAFEDHFSYQSVDIHFNDDLDILMTEKDAVKCRTYAGDRHWYVPVTIDNEDSLFNSIITKLTYN